MMPLAALALLVAVATAHAEGMHEMQAALFELKVAQDHLRAAGTAYGGHRRTALEHVANAIKEVHQGIQLAREGQEGGREPKPKAPSKPSAEPGDKPSAEPRDGMMNDED